MQDIHLIQAFCSIQSYRVPMGFHGRRSMDFDHVNEGGGGGGVEGGGEREEGGGGRGGGRTESRGEYDYILHIPEVFHHPSRLKSATSGDHRLQAPLETRRQTSPNFSTDGEGGSDNAAYERIITHRV